jgi:hypothetical protein
VGEWRALGDPQRLCVDRSVEVVGERDREHSARAVVLRAPEIEARLDAARALDRELGLGQVDLVGVQHELCHIRERVGELEVDRRAAGREVDQRRVGEAYVDPAGERGDRRVSALDQSVVADRLDLLEVVGVGDGAPGEIADRAAGALDRALELADAAEGQAGRRAALGRAEPGLSLRDGADCGGRRAGSGELQRIELSLTPAWRKNAGTLGMPTSIV